MRRETIGGYLRAAGIAVRGRGRRGERAAKPAISAQVSTDLAPPNPAISPGVSTDPGGRAPTRAPSASACEPYRELIVAALARGRNAVAIWQDLVDDHGFTAKYASVRRFVVRLRGRRARRGPRRDHGPRRAKKGRSTTAVTGRWCATRRAANTGGRASSSSRWATRASPCGWLVWRSSAQTWAELHERTFRRLGGTARIVVLDNLKEGVLTPDIYDPTLNPLYRDVLAHYGVVALPCRVRDPDRKGKVEAGVGHAQKTPLKGLRFETLEAAQAYLDRWETRWADTRIHGTTKRQVAEMFAEERPALGPLPAGAVSLLPLWRAHGASGWLRRGRGRVLQRAAGLDRPARAGAMERPARPADRADDRAAPPRTSARAPRLASDPRCRPSRPDAGLDAGLAGARGHGRAPISARCVSTSTPRGARRRAPDPRRPRPREASRAGRRRGRREGGGRHRRAHVSLCARNTSSAGRRCR